MTALTRDKVVAIIGSAEDSVIAQVLAMGASREELAEAHARVSSDEALMNTGRPLPSGRIGRLIEILQAVEDESPAVMPPE